MALVGGETAEHPGVMRPDDVDLAGAALGVVEYGSQIDGSAVRVGDVVIGLISPNLRSNGFSLVRKVFAGQDLADAMPGEDSSIGEVLTRPSVLFTPHVLAAIETGEVRGAAHITGGGLPGNLPRTLGGFGATLDPDTWEIPNVFKVITSLGGIEWADMAAAFNLGIGFCLIVEPGSAESVLDATSGAGSRIIGRVEDEPGVRFARPLG